MSAIPRSLLRGKGGESFVLPSTPRFGPMYASQVLRQAAERYDRLLGSVRLSSEHDELIRRQFEQLRGGRSADSFLSDPQLVQKLAKACARNGLKAPDYAINFRLLGMRKHNKNAFKTTETPTRSRHLIETLGPGVEMAMRLVKFRFGASVDDLLAYPTVGEVFVRAAASINPGATGLEYRLCALQIRKSRHLTGTYEELASDLSLPDLDGRWINLGSAERMARRDVPEGAGIIELLTPNQSVYVLRTGKIEQSLHKTFQPEQVKNLVNLDHFIDVDHRQLTLRAITKTALPGGTPKAWELKIIDERNPVLNWPVHAEAA